MPQLSIWDADNHSDPPASSRHGATPNPSARHHLDVAGDHLDHATRMLALARKAPKDSATRISAAASAQSLAGLVNERCDIARTDPHGQPSSNEDTAPLRKKAKSIHREALELLGAERPTRPRKRTTKPSPSRRTKQSSKRAKTANENPSTLRARQLLRGVQ